MLNRQAVQITAPLNSVGGQSSTRPTGCQPFAIWTRGIAQGWSILLHGRIAVVPVGMERGPIHKLLRSFRVPVISLMTGLFRHRRYPAAQTQAKPGQCGPPGRLLDTQRHTLIRGERPEGIIYSQPSHASHCCRPPRPAIGCRRQSVVLAGAHDQYRTSRLTNYPFCDTAKDHASHAGAPVGGHGHQPALRL